MTRYLLIASRDPYEGADVGEDYALARDLATSGEEVTVLLVQNGVLPSRRGARPCGLEALVASGVHVAADAFSLRERAIPPGRLGAGISPASIDMVLDALERGERVLWL
jgi:hypothetical protein